MTLPSSTVKDDGAKKESMADTMAADPGTGETALAIGATQTTGAGYSTMAGTTVPRGQTVLPRLERVDGQLQLVRDPTLRYEERKRLGEGGMGVVSLAHDKDIDRDVALKRVRSDIGEQGIARFAQEVRTVGNLEHPNIVPVHDVGVDENGDYFFVMKYVQGETLADIIKRLAEGDLEAHRRFTFEVRAQVFIGLLRALAYAHDRGVIHRDIKPANVMVGPYGEVVLMDWGIARPIDGPEPVAEGTEDEDPQRSVDDAPMQRIVQTRADGLIGTPAYMAPEQATGRADLDARCDLYAACVVFHEFLTLRHYLASSNGLPAILAGVVGEQLPPVHRPDLYAHPKQAAPPAEFLHFLHRGMEKDPDARWQSAQEMLDRLEALAEGRVPIQCPVTFSKRMVRELGRLIDRHPGGVTLVVALLALGIPAGLIAMIVALVT
jgi:serine/threonine-protein kinase